MKYIIDIEDEYTKDWVNESPMCKELCMPISVPNRQRTYHVGTGFKLEPYTEPDRKSIEDEVWNLANEIAYCMSHEECVDAGMLCEEDGYDDASGVLEKLTYQEAKAAYVAWKKQKDEIRVGDEVEYTCCNNKTVRFIVTGIADGIAYGFKHICEYDDSGEYCDIDMLWKTGRHFDEVEELLKKIKEDS